MQVELVFAEETVARVKAAFGDEVPLEDAMRKVVLTYVGQKELDARKGQLEQQKAATLNLEAQQIAQELGL
jgi:hypothetical protein